MNMDSLPDDVSQWPQDPWRILGVERSFTKKELKLAYSKLIKRYRPESAPEAFQKIRQAYETLQHYADADAETAAVAHLIWNHLQTTDEKSVEDDGNSAEDHSAENSEHHDAGHETSTERSQSRRQAHRDLDPWQLAKAGEYEKAYAELARRGFTRPHFEREMLQRYWLLTLHPELDRTTTACDQLLNFATSHRLSDEVERLLLAEVSNRPELATRSQIWKLISGRYNQSFRLSLLRVRWKGLLKDDGDEVVLQEFEELESQYFDDPAQWLTIVILLLELVVVDHPRLRQPLFDRCQTLLNELESEGVHQQELFDRADYLISNYHDFFRSPSSLVRTSKSIRFLYRRCLEVATELEHIEGSRSREILLPLIDQIVNHPQSSLMCLDELLKKSAPWLQILSQAIYQLWYEEYSQYEALEFEGLKSEAQRDTVLMGLISASQISYNSLRGRVLRFCLVHCIDMTKLVPVLQMIEIANKATTPRADMLLKDKPLRCLIQACQIGI